MTSRWRAFTLIEMLVVLAVGAALSAIIVKRPSSAGSFRRAESLLSGYLNGVVGHIQFRDSGEFFLLIGGGDEGSACELMLVRGLESQIPVGGFHLNLKGLASIVIGDEAGASNLSLARAVDWGQGSWIVLSAKELSGENFSIVLRSTGKRPIYRRLSLSPNGNVIGESISRIHFD